MIKIQEEAITQNGRWKRGAHLNHVGDVIVANIKPKSRIESIDLLRGIIMIIMAIDHVRDYFHFDAFLYSPVDISQTSAGLFFTRWITHLCAPTFIFLAGVSAFFIAQRKTRNDTSFFFLSRGIWLVLLQLTLIRFAWNFDPFFHYNSNTIISTIGICMIVLSGLIYLPMKTIFFTGLVMVIGHNLLDGISFEEGTLIDALWSFLHVQKSFDLGNGYVFAVLYPIIPWVGVMALGYCFGILYDRDYSAENRRAMLSQLGIVCLIIFFTLRTSNVYGDPNPWTKQAEIGSTFMSFLNLEKYPPSLLFLSVTLGISLLLLAAMEGKNLSKWKPLTLFGKVALFYYVAHIFLIHLLAMLAATLTGYSWHSMIFPGPPAQGSTLLNGYGFSLWEVYAVWVLVIFLLYPLCVYWNALKIRNMKKWWVSYI
ncbi:MAG TPA: heparan-alpha-glucosaminide N-acetyltransferase domain-containing protein [Chryseolinea sp.]|nr:heparan-alpha-glucosaminide N-acetyltransferase domain-containing protein [Chryseolinea sp.]